VRLLFTTSRSASLLTQARAEWQAAMGITAARDRSARLAALDRTQRVLRDVTVGTRSKQRGKGVLVAAEAAELNALVAYAHGDFEQSLATLMAAANMYSRWRSSGPNEGLSRVAGTAARYFARIGSRDDASNFAVASIKLLDSPEKQIAELIYVSCLVTAAEPSDLLAQLVARHPARGYAEPERSLLTIVEHHVGGKEHAPQILRAALHRLSSVDLDLQVQLGLYLVSDGLRRGAPGLVQDVLTTLLDRSTAVADTYLVQARLLQTQAHVAARAGDWPEALESGLAAWCLFDEVRYRCGVPRLRIAIHQFGRRARHSAMRAAVALGDARLLLELIEASRLQSSIDIVGSARDVEDALRGRTPASAADDGAARTVRLADMRDPYRKIAEELLGARSDLTAPIDLHVGGCSSIAESRASVDWRFPFVPVDRSRIDASEIVSQVASGPHYWWSSWYEEGTVFSGLTRDGEPIAVTEIDLSADDDLRSALTAAAVGNGMTAPWPAVPQMDVAVDEFLATSESFRELTFTGTLSRLLPEELRSSAPDGVTRPLVLSCAAELAGVPWPVLPVDLTTQPARRLVEEYELRFMPSLAALRYRPPATTEPPSGMPFLLSCDHLPGDDFPVDPRPAHAVLGRPGQRRLIDRVVPPTVENTVTALRRYRPGTVGLAFFRSHYLTEPNDPASSGIALSNGILAAGMLGVTLDGTATMMVPMPSRVILSCCASSGAQERHGGEALGMAAMCLRAGASQVIATSVAIQQAPFTNALDDMLVALGQSESSLFPAVRVLHLRLLSEWRRFSGRGGTDDDVRLGCPTPHIWAHYQTFGFE
jgi:hypothetical protein